MAEEGEVVQTKRWWPLFGQQVGNPPMCYRRRCSKVPKWEVTRRIGVEDIVFLYCDDHKEGR